MADLVELRQMVPDDYEAAMAVARSLPEWSNTQGIEEIAEALSHQQGAVVLVNEHVVGWVTWQVHEDLGEIAWIAVGPEHRRQGIGVRLLEFAEDRLSVLGATEVQVETFGESVDCEPYERTRAFCHAVGFRDIKSVMTDNPGTPESLTLLKTIALPSGDG
jgi:ribosomal protein S18 acetylase RimI-like enzyme